MVLHLIILFGCLQWVQCCGDYYWRDYTMFIPRDALKYSIPIDEGGFIGHAIFNDSVLPGQIKHDQNGMAVVHFDEIRNANSMIHILCAPDYRRFFWIPATYENYTQVTKNLCPVLGGYDFEAAKTLDISAAPLHIGRTLDRKTVGYIPGYSSPTSNTYHFLFYVEDGLARQSTVFYVLVYSDYPSLHDHSTY